MTVKLQLLALVNNEFLSFSFFCRFPNSNDSDDVLESHRPLRSLRNTSGRTVNTSSLSTYPACQQLLSVNISGLSTPPDWTVITSGLICQHLRLVNTSRLDCQHLWMFNTLVCQHIRPVNNSGLSTSLACQHLSSRLPQRTTEVCINYLSILSIISTLTSSNFL